MVAPDGAGEKAVVSAFVNERLLASTVAAIGEPTHLDFALPDGLVGTVANIRAVVQRRSAQGDCRFEPQGYPAEILGSSSISLLERGTGRAGFLRPGHAVGRTASRSWCRRRPPASPLPILGMLADVLSALSKETRPIAVKYVDRRVGASAERAVHRRQQRAARRRQAARALRPRPGCRGRSRRPHACSISAGLPPARSRRS